MFLFLKKMHFIKATSLNINKAMSVVMDGNKKGITLFVYDLFKRNKLYDVFLLFFMEKKWYTCMNNLQLNIMCLL